MYPILLTLGPIHFYSYGLFLAMGLGLSIYLFAKDVGNKLAPKIGLSYQQGFQKAFDLGTWVIIFSILGARLFYVLENHEEFQNGRWLDAVKIWQGGLVYYGGLFGAIGAAIVWYKIEKWPTAFAFDLVAPYILLGQAIGRVGCFLNGCCYGNEDHVYGMVFPGAPDQLPHLPTQLWEMAGDLILFFILWRARKWTLRFPWLSSSLYGLTYGLLRFVIEFWRRDWNKHYLVIFNSASQAVSGLIVMLSLAMVLVILLDARKVRKSSAN